MKRIALAVLAVLMFIPTTRADSVITVQVTDVTFGGYIGPPEVLNISYVEDVTTGVATDYEFSMSGPLGTFTGPVGALGGIINWTDSEGDFLQFNPEADDPAQSPPFPNVGSYPPGVLFNMFCNGPTCVQIMGGTFVEPDFGLGSVSVTAPEPGLMLMLVSGIALVGLLRKSVLAKLD